MNEREEREKGREREKVRERGRDGQEILKWHECVAKSLLQVKVYQMDRLSSSQFSILSL